ncbi:PfkB family carbohydrate kinase [Termitidicoccus mucosus]|uniref:Sugar kinase n=1 Tax=Termitidicoccus mucosus TaxID=1184151 RepID=A0A178IM10_9BACT|nr:sugar kinase [Opitutaceae bacterium TSB47]
MSFKKQALEELAAKRAAIGQKHAVVGLDGFVDTIVTPVALRTGQGEDFTPIDTITAFGQRVLSAAGKSTNIEFYPRMEKLGGNGPIMANALLAAGSRLTYIGALGKDTLHPVFQDMATRSDTISLCAPAHTTAVEFDDGKLMLGQMKSFDEITYAKLIETITPPRFTALLAGADLLALVNWTMIPNMTGIFEGIVQNILPALPPRERIFFFDLADPEKRAPEDLVAALQIVARFEYHGRVTLGLNLKEAQQVYAALGLGVFLGEEEKDLRHAASAIREKLALSTVVVHPRKSAACATPAGDWWLPGPYCEKPLITTGAGDHFNAGFTTGQLLGLTPQSCLALGVSTSGHYVRSAHSPTLADLETFLARWR